MKRYLFWAGIAAAAYAVWHYLEARKLGVPMDWAFGGGHLFLGSPGMAAAWAYQYGSAPPNLQGPTPATAVASRPLSGLRAALGHNPIMSR